MKLGNFRQQHKTGAIIYRNEPLLLYFTISAVICQKALKEGPYIRDVQALMFTDRVAFK